MAVVYHWLIVAHALRQKALALRKKAAEISLRVSLGDLASTEMQQEHEQLLQDVEASAKAYLQVKSQMDERPSGLKLTLTSRTHLASDDSPDEHAGSNPSTRATSPTNKESSENHEYKVVSI